MIHQAHRIKTDCLEAQSLVGLVFCFSKFARFGTLFKALSDNRCAFVDQRCHIVHGEPPPAGAAARANDLFNILFDLDSSHHSRGKSGERKSQLWQDFHNLTALDNGGVLGDRIVHHCWAPGGGQCCEGADDTKDKFKAAFVNLFVSRCWPEGTLSRWTHVRTLLGLISAGYLCIGILHTSLEPLLDDGDFNAEHAEASGRQIQAELAWAGDADDAVQHRARKAKVLTWMRKPETPWQVALVFVTSTVLDKITYLFMTGGQGSSPTKPGTMAKAEQPIDMGKLWRLVRSSRVQYMDLHRQFAQSPSCAASCAAWVCQTRLRPPAVVCCSSGGMP